MENYTSTDYYFLFIQTQQPCTFVFSPISVIKEDLSQKQDPANAKINDFSCESLFSPSFSAFY